MGPPTRRPARAVRCRPHQPGTLQRYRKPGPPRFVSCARIDRQRGSFPAHRSRRHDAHHDADRRADRQGGSGARSSDVGASLRHGPARERAGGPGAGDGSGRGARAAGAERKLAGAGPAPGRRPRRALCLAHDLQRRRGLDARGGAALLARSRRAAGAGGLAAKRAGAARPRRSLGGGPRHRRHVRRHRQPGIPARSAGVSRQRRRVCARAEHRPARDGTASHRQSERRRPADLGRQPGGRSALRWTPAGRHAGGCTWANAISSAKRAAGWHGWRGERWKAPR